MNFNIQSIPCYVINLESYKDKWVRTSKILNDINIKPQRFEAVYGKNIDPEIINKITDPSVYYSIKNERSIDQQINSLGAIGCYLSHLKLWESLTKSDEDTFLIFEDDISLMDFTTLDKINEFVNKVIKYQKDWDFIFLGYSKPLPFFSKDICNDKICKINEITFCTHSYIINKKGARKLLEKAYPIVHQIDSYISYMASRGDINCFRPEKPYFSQECQSNIFTSVSSIQEGPLKSIKTIITRFENRTVFLSLLFIILLFFCFLFLIFQNRINESFKGAKKVY
jgi:glycosyl transferase family 25